MNTPKKAMVLAAGLGSRMLPLSLDKPKPMMPLWGKPVLGHIFDALHEWGVNKVLINLHHHPDPIIRYIREQNDIPLQINLSFEPELQGTGGALRQAQWFLDDSPFWMINADIAFTVNPKPILKMFRDQRSLAVLWLHPDQGPRTVEMADSVITNFSSNRQGTQGTYTFCGLQMLSPNIFKYIPKKGFSTIIQAYKRAMADGQRINGTCVSDSYWTDIGTPKHYLKAHADILDRFQTNQPGGQLFDQTQLKLMETLQKNNVRIKGFVSQGTNVAIEKGAVVSNSVIWDGAKIASDSVVENAIIGTRTLIHGRIPQTAVCSDSLLKAGIHPADKALIIALNKLHWNPETTTIIPFEPRGSARVFTRLEHAGQSVIMIQYSLERKENALYTQHARFLKTIGLSVPSIILDDPEKQLIIIEDLGDQSLQSAIVKFTLHKVVMSYQKIIEAIILLHGKGTEKARRINLPMTSSFSIDLYRWERKFFAHHFLEKHLHIRAARIRQIMNELHDVSSRLLQTRPVLIHRDLQSSNIMFVNRQPYFIDFQGMRFGAAAYDLASLLCDPYAELPFRFQKKLMEHYNTTGSSLNPVSEEQFWLAAIERLAQALGAYGRLSANPDTVWFKKYIPPGMRMIQRALEQIDMYPQLQAVIRNALDQGRSNGVSEYGCMEVYPGILPGL